MDSQLYALFVADEVKGPFSRQQIDEMIQQGQVGRETLCAPVGSSEWQPAAELFSFSSERSFSSRTEEEKPRLNPEVRKRVIQLGFADAATVDLLTPTQAIAALKAHDEGLAKEKKQKKLAVLAGLPVALLAGSIFGITPPGEQFNVWVAKKFVKPSPQFLHTQGTVRQELVSISGARENLAKTELKAPVGRPGRPHFEQRVHIPVHAANEFVFKIETNQFKDFATEEPKIVYLKSIPRKIREEMIRQTELVWKYLHPESLVDSLNEAELAASWELFKQQTSSDLADFVAENTQSTAQIAKDGELRIQGSRPDNLAAIVDIRGVPVYLINKAQEHLTLSDPRRHTVTRQDALDSERYAVVKKQAVGGKPYGTRVRFQNKDYFLKRTTPVWYYLGLARQEIDQSPNWVMVSAEEYAQTDIGTEFATKKLFDHTVFDTPQQSPLEGPFEPLQP